MKKYSIKCNFKSLKVKTYEKLISIRDQYF